MRREYFTRRGRARSTAPGTRNGAARAFLLVLAFHGAAAASGEAGFSVRVNGETNPYEVFGVYVMPGHVVKLEIAAAPQASRFELRAAGTALRPDDPGAWTWRAPMKPGLQTLELRRLDGPGTMTLHVFVLVPASRIRAGFLNGYRIGRYPARPLNDLDIYRPPRGFIEVTPANLNVRVSPRFTLGQFLCKQEADFPKYLLLRERLLLSLEHLWKAANARGWHCDTFHVMSGYRTPYYNQSIGNVPYSRHLWGGAVDIFIDANPQDGVMDDLNGDGRVDKADADVLYDFFEATAAESDFEAFEGGLGCYDSTPAHGPFVHVDVRGTRARWGR